jgi:hypothetical protein
MSIKDKEMDMEMRIMAMEKRSDIKRGFKRQLAVMSYYNAAEGMYSVEKTKRDHCRAQLLTFAALLKEDGFSKEDIKNIAADYMVSERDFTPRSK